MKREDIHYTMSLTKENDMKRYISILMILIILFCSNAFAVLIDVTKEVPKDNTLVYPDLQEVAIDDRGNQKFDRYTKELL